MRKLDDAHITVISPHWRCRMTLPDDRWPMLWPGGVYYVNGAVDPLSQGKSRQATLGPKPKEGKRA